MILKSLSLTLFSAVTDPLRPGAHGPADAEDDHPTELMLWNANWNGSDNHSH